MKFKEYKSLQSLAILLLALVSGIVFASPYQTLDSQSQIQVSGDENDTCVAEYSCVNCTTVRICIKKWKEDVLTKLLDFQCDGKTPYCDFDTGTCRATPSNDTCGSQDSDFICPSEGYYPHPTDCRKYYSCIEGKAYRLDCLVGYCYNSKSENCQSINCYKVTCKGTFGAKVAYTQDNSYYGYCFNETLIRFDKCPASFQLDEHAQICKPKCTVQGEQGDPYDCTRYYKCSYDSKWTLQPYHYQCPQGQLYDALNFHCTPLNISLSCASGHTFVKK